MNQYDKKETHWKLTAYLSLKGRNHSYIYSISFIWKVSPTTLEILKMKCLSGFMYSVIEIKLYLTVYGGKEPSGQLCYIYDCI